MALVNAAPAKIDAISIADLSSVSPIYPLTITFSRNMDRQSVEQAFSINNDGKVELSWTNDYTLNVDLKQLDALWQYTITIDGSVAKNSQTGQLLDGDGDGAEGGDYTLTFTMAEPDVTAPEAVATIPQPKAKLSTPSARPSPWNSTRFSTGTKTATAAASQSRTPRARNTPSDMLHTS